MILSMKLRVASMPLARSRARALNSGTSVENSLVTSITGALSLPMASILNAMMMDGFFEASTAAAMGSFAVGRKFIGDFAQQHAILAALPAHHMSAGELSAIAGPDGGSRDLTDHQKILAQLRRGNFVVIAALDLVDFEHARRGLRVFGNHAIVRPRLRIGATSSGPDWRGRQAPRQARRFGGGRGFRDLERTGTERWRARGLN